MLVDAVDRDAARQIVESQLPAIQDAICTAHRQMDALSCGQEFLEKKLKSMPALQPAFEGGGQKIERLRTAVDQNVEIQELLMR
jgi:hypothetical protein